MTHLLTRLDDGFKKNYDLVVHGGTSPARLTARTRARETNQLVHVTLTVEPARDADAVPSTAPAAELAGELAALLGGTVADTVVTRLNRTVAEMRGARSAMADARTSLEKALAVVAAPAAAAPQPPSTPAGDPAAEAAAREGTPAPKEEQAELTEVEVDAAESTAAGRRWDVAGVAAAVLSAACLATVVGVAALVFYHRPRADRPIPDEFAQRVADRVVVTSPDPAVAERLAEIKTAVDAKSGPAGLTADEREKLEKLIGQLKAAAAGVAAAKDVLVVVTHASNMHAGDYKDALHNALIRDRARGKDQPTRVGLALGRAGQLDFRVPLDATEPGAKVNLDIPLPDGQAEEEASLLGGKASKDVRWEREVRRAVLVVSTDCEPVPKLGHSWKDFSDVHVVVLARRPLVPAKDADRFARWSDFVATTKGTLQLILHPGKLDEQNRALELTLRGLIDLPRPH